MKLKLIVVEKFHYYVVFSKAILFLSGLIFSNRFVSMAVFSILITHLTEWQQYALPEVVSIVNIQEGAYAVLQLFLAFLADAYTGHFKMVLCSTPFYIIGLSLCFVAARNELVSIFYAALVMITFSQAALKVTLEAFLDDQVPSTAEDAERANKFWWNLFSLLAAIAAYVGVWTISSFVTLTMISAVLMGAAFCWFLLGIRHYIRDEPAGSGLSDVGHVIYTAAVTKRNAVYPQSPDQLHQNWGGLLHISPHVSWLRWLYRAAVLVPQDEEENPSCNNTCTVEQVKGVKFLIKMIPMWTTFLTFSLVSALGTTFFQEQANETDEISPLLLILLQEASKFGAMLLSDFTLEMLEKRKNMVIGHQKMMLVRIGLGMTLCVLCCLAAWINVNNDMSVTGLILQYILLGLMEGLSEDGLQNFFNSQVSESVTRYGPPLDECVQGIGKILSVICILVLDKLFKWFGRDISSSQLDRYYAMLGILSSINVIIYCFVAYWYGDDKFLQGNENGDLQIIIHSTQEDEGHQVKDVADSDSGTQLYQHPSSSGTRSRFQSRSYQHRPPSRATYKRFNSLEY